MIKMWYTDPLQAAWMAREFEVKYADPTGVSNAPYEIFPTLDRMGELSFGLRNGTHECYGYKYYIHETSLPIFEPQEGDIIVECNGDLDRGYVMPLRDKQPDGRFTLQFGDEILLEKPQEDWKTIQRDNKAFFMPEKEE